MASVSLDPAVVVGLGAALVTGLFTLLGVLFAGRQGRKQLALQLNAEHTRATSEARRERLEELYCLIQQWSGAVVMHHVTYRKVMDGIISYNQALDIELGGKQGFDVSRMMMLADLYFPEARPQFTEVMHYRDQAAAVHSEFRELYRVSGQSSSPHSVTVTGILEKFNVAVEAYKNSLVQHARQV